ncbi:MAG: hypothetical protein M9938_00980 [Solirubrobacterales bacterium]|nr:hypothetical protein [Solirubrobacterales bacterium]
MNVRLQTFAGIAGLLALFGATLVVLVASFGLAPATVFASSATDQYTEPVVPTVPGKKDPGGGSGSEDGGNGSGSRAGGKDGRGGSADGSADGRSANGGDGSGVTGEAGTRAGQEDSDRIAALGPNGVDSEEADGAVAAFKDSGSGGIGGAGGSSITIILLIAIPILAGWGYALFRRRQQRSDADAKDRIHSILNGQDPASSEKP